MTIVAIDRIGNMATAKLILQATDPEGGKETGYEPPNIIYSKNNGFNIFQKDDWLNHNFDATPQYSFVLDSEDAAVVVVSKNLLNTEARNHLEVVNITTKKVVYSTDVAFNRYKFTSGFYCYQAFIDIDSPMFSTNERYMVNVMLEDNAAPSHRIPVSHEISTRNGGSYPAMQTFQNRTDSKVTTNFWNNDIIEVKITSISFPANSIWYGGGGDIIIRDFSGRSPLHWAPAVPASGSPQYYWKGGPVSNVVKIDATTYAFAINLTAAKSGDPWSPGRNQAYILDYDMFTLKDTIIPNKYYQYQLSSIILHLLAHVQRRHSRGFRGGCFAQQRRGRTVLRRQRGLDPVQLHAVLCERQQLDTAHTHRPGLLERPPAPDHALCWRGPERGRTEQGGGLLLCQYQPA